MYVIHHNHYMRTLVIASLLILISLIHHYLHMINIECGCTKVILLDVGQGSGLYIYSQGEEILIDTGETHKTLRELGKVREPLDTTIEHLFLTHADRDHIGRAPELLGRLDVGVVYSNGIKRDDPVSEFINNHEVRKQSLVAGNTFQIGDVSLEVLWPVDDTGENKNDSSLVMKLTIGVHTLLVAGDITKRVEKQLVRIYGDHLRSDILLVPHHGSKSSSSKMFLDAVRPQVALISAGKDNRFGHPHDEVVKRLQNKNIRIFNTARDGTTIFGAYQSRFAIIHR